MERPNSSAELRDLLSTPAPLLCQGRLRGLALSQIEAGGFERVGLGGLDAGIEVHAADLRATVGVGASLADIEAAAAEVDFCFLELPLLDPRATLYDLALAGVLSRFQPAGGRLAGRVTGLWTPTPNSSEALLIGCRTAKGVAGYNLARTALLCRPSLPAQRYEILLMPRRGASACYRRDFPGYAVALEFAVDKNGPLWRVPGLTAVELLADDTGATLAVSRAGRYPDEAAEELQKLGFTTLEPAAWHRRKAGLLTSLAEVRSAVSVEPPTPAETAYGDPLAGPWLYAAADNPAPVLNPVLEELWPRARLIPAATLA